MKADLCKIPMITMKHLIHNILLFWQRWCIRFFFLITLIVYMTFWCSRLTKSLLKTNIFENSSKQRLKRLRCTAFTLIIIIGFNKKKKKHHQVRSRIFEKIWGWRYLKWRPSIWNEVLLKLTVNKYIPVSIPIIPHNSAVAETTQWLMWQGGCTMNERFSI